MVLSYHVVLYQIIFEDAVMSVVQNVEFVNLETSDNYTTQYPNTTLFFLFSARFNVIPVRDCS